VDKIQTFAAHYLVMLHNKSYYLVFAFALFSFYSLALDCIYCIVQYAACVGLSGKQTSLS